MQDLCMFHLHPTYFMISTKTAVCNVTAGIDMPSNVQDEMTYPFPNFIGCTVEVWEWVSSFHALLLIHAGIKVGPCY